MTDNLPPETRTVKPQDKRSRIYWPPNEFAQIEEVARRRNARDHTDFDAVDIIKIATRRMVAEELGSEAV
jgi:hypothetical protein